MDRAFDQTDGNNVTSAVPREEVRQLQRYLRTLSYAYPEIPSPPIDGIFDTATRDALIAFQSLAGLSPTGIADYETWRLLYSAYLDALFDASLPTRLPLFPVSPIDYAAKKGDSSFLVAAIQFLIDDISTTYGLRDKLPITGYFDEDTEESVKELQGLFLLPQTGEVNKRLWNYLVGAYVAEDVAREQTRGSETETVR